MGWGGNEPNKGHKLEGHVMSGSLANSRPVEKAAETDTKEDHKLRT